MKGSYGASLVVRAIGTWAVIYGVLISIGGPGRWSNPAYDVVNLMPGSPYTWAVIMLTGGLITMLGSLYKTNLPLPNFTISHPILAVKDWTGRWMLPVLTLDTKRELVDWNNTQVRNIGLLILAAWWFLFGLALIIGVWNIPNVGYGAGGNQLLLCVICVVMTKVREPVKL